MAVIISGKIHEKTTELLDSYFGNIVSKNIYVEDPPDFPGGELRKKVHTDKSGTVQSAIRIGSPTINKRHSAYHGLKILNTVLEDILDRG